MPAPAARRLTATPVEAYTTDSLQQTFQQMLEAVRQTQFMLPVTFHDGMKYVVDMCRMKKGDRV